MVTRCVRFTFVYQDYSKLHSNIIADENVIDSISRKFRLRIQVKQCRTNAKIVSSFKRDLRVLISKDICSAPCEIHAVTLKCRSRKKMNILHTSLEIRMNPNVIFSRAWCNSSCIRCEAESKLQRIISNLKRLVNSDKFVLSFDGQKYVLDRKNLKGMKPKSRCKRAPRRSGKNVRYFKNISLPKCSVNFHLFFKRNKNSDFIFTVNFRSLFNAKIPTLI